MIQFFQQLFKEVFCKHDYSVFVRNIYGDEINVVNGKRSFWKCRKCGKWVAKGPLHRPQ